MTGLVRFAWSVTTLERRQTMRDAEQFQSEEEIKDHGWYLAQAQEVEKDG
jgi:hypothetical protein